MAKISCEWNCNQLAGESPKPRTGHSVVRLKNEIFLFGGVQFNNNNSEVTEEYLNDLWCLSFCENEVRWKSISFEGFQPSPRESHECILDGKNMYLFGGKEKATMKRCLKETCRFTLGVDDDGISCEKLEHKGPFPEAIGFSASKVQRKVYIFGGLLDGTPTNQFFLFDIDDLCYVPLRNPEIKARCDHSSVVVGNSVYIYGGAGSIDEFYNDLWRFDTDYMSWEEIVSKGVGPDDRAGHTLLAHGDKDLYVFGGSQNQRNQLKPINHFHKFSLKKQKWKRVISGGITKLTESIHGHQTFIYHSQLYFIGGIQSSGEVPLNEIYHLRLINPSERKLVGDHFLQEIQFDDRICFTPKIRLSKSCEDSNCEIEEGINNFLTAEKVNLEQLGSDYVSIRDQSFENNAASDESYQVLGKRLAESVQRLEDEKQIWSKLLESQKLKTEDIIKHHQKQMDKCWKYHRSKLINEQLKLQQAKEKISEEQEALTKEKAKFEERVKQFGVILENFT